MAEDEAIAIRPAWGGPALKKNGCLTLRGGILQATDRHGRSSRFDLTDSQGPYRFLFGTWKGEADYALVNARGRAVLLLDRKAFRREDFARVREAAGLDFDEADERPPTESGCSALVNPPYLLWGTLVFAVGALAFGLWSVTHAELLILGVTLPALLALIPLVVLARTSMMSGKEFVAESANIDSDVNEALRDADTWLASHGSAPTPDSGSSAEEPDEQ